jgi:hypothetical protein
MKIKTNRTQWFYFGVLFGLLSWNFSTISSTQNTATSSASIMPAVIIAEPDSGLQASIDSKEEPNQSTRQLLKRLGAMHTAQKSFFIELFNNIVDIFKLSSTFENNPHALKTLEDLEVRVSSREVPHNKWRRIPRSHSKRYMLEITMPRGYIPSFVASLQGNSHFKAMVFKALTFWTSPFEICINYGFYYDCQDQQQECIANFLLDHPEVIQMLAHVAEGNYREATRYCKIDFQFPATFVISLPTLGKEHYST